MSSSNKSLPGAAADGLQEAIATYSAVLRCDYLSDGRGHRQTRQLHTLRAEGKKPRRAERRKGACDDEHAPHWFDPCAADAAHTCGATDEPRAVPDGPPLDDITHRYLAEVARKDRLASSQEYQLARQAKQGVVQARQRLVEHHLGLVVTIAKGYQNRGLALLDLIEEGNLGLMAAIDKFDPELGFRLATYAKSWVRRAIEYAIMTQSPAVKVPVYVTKSLKRERRSMRCSDGGAQHNGEAARYRLDAVAMSLQSALSLDAAFSTEDGQDQALIETLAAPNEASPEHRVLADQHVARLQEALAQLNGKERLVIERRFGLLDQEVATLEELAGVFELSSERIRQIQNAALRKLRDLLAARGLEAQS